MMKTMITLMASAVLLAITSNVADALQKNPNPFKKPPTVIFDWGKTGTEKEKKIDKCDEAHLHCIQTVSQMRVRKSEAWVGKALLKLRKEKGMQTCAKNHIICVNEAGGQQ